MKEYFTIPEVAEKLNLSIYTIRSYVSRKKIKHTKFGGAVRFSEDQIQDFINESIVEIL